MKLALAEQKVECGSGRRRSKRRGVVTLMPALIATNDAVVLDISLQGARVVHHAPLVSGNTESFVVLWSPLRVTLTAQVLASRVLGLGNGPNPSTAYESRLQFICVRPEQSMSLHRILRDLESARIREWADSRFGEAGTTPLPETEYFIRCTPLFGRWSKRATSDFAQPPNGFTVSYTVSNPEIDMLCQAFERMDAAGRDLVRRTAALNNARD